MNTDSVDKLLQLAWLEGWITTRGAYEKAVLKSPPVPIGFNAGALIRRLERALADTPPSQSLTVGQMLRSLRAEHHLRSQEVFLRLGLSQNIYRLLERDAISPLRIPVDVWRKLLHMLSLPVDDLAAKIRRTHQLLLYRASFKGVLARYTARTNKGLKKTTLEQAYTELYAKATLRLPEADERKLNQLFENLRSKE